MHGWLRLVSLFFGWDQFTCNAAQRPFFVASELDPWPAPGWHMYRFVWPRLVMVIGISATYMLS